MSGGNGKIINFYSYKAGAGRSMALANVSWIMASNGLRVLAVDWDLDSPGLTRYFLPYLDQTQLRSTGGVIEFIRAFVTAPAEPTTAVERRSLMAQYAQAVRSAAVALNHHFPGDGQIDVVPAGQPGPAFADTVAQLDWNRFYEQPDGAVFLDALREELTHAYDYVLVDCRSGVADGVRTGTVVPPDAVAVCFSMTIQSVDGGAMAAHLISQYRRDREIRILPVSIAAEDVEPSRADAARDRARREFAEYVHLDGADLNRYWANVDIPHRGSADDELVAASPQLSPPARALLAAYERLASVLTDGRVERLGQSPAGDDQPLPASRDPSMRTDVLVSFASADRMWSEWVAAELAEAGLRVRQQPLDVGEEAEAVPVLLSATAAARRMLILLSEEYLRSPLAAELSRLSTSAGGPAMAAPPVVVRLDATRPPPALAQLPAVELDNADEAESSADLRRALGLPLRATAPDGVAASPRTGPRLPTTLPTVWNVPARNADFTGRGALLDALRLRFRTQAMAARPQVLVGLGGVGKTQVALEYAHRFAAEYDVVWWINAETSDLARADLHDLAQRLGILAHPPIDHLLHELRLGRPYARWLLVYDNVESPEDVKDLMPPGPGHVLITSRNRTWDEIAAAESVEVFTRTESVALLHRRLPRMVEDDAGKLADSVGNLPLAVGQAAAYLAGTGTTVDDYLDRLEHAPIDTLVHTEELGGERTRASATWLLSLVRLRERMPAAARAFEICAFLGPEPIPQALLSTGLVVSTLTAFDATLRDRLMLGRVTNEFVRLGLAHVDAGKATIEIHRLVQAVVRAQMSTQEANKTRDLAYQALAATNPGDPDRPEHWPLCQVLWSHLSCPGLLEMDDDGVRQLVVDLIHYRYKRSDYVGSEHLCEQTLQRWSVVQGPDDLFTLQVHYHRAKALRRLGRFEPAYQLDRDTLERLQRTAGPDNPHTLMCKSSLAVDLRALGRYREALELDQETLPRFRDSFGDNHERTLIFASNLADSYRMVGDYTKAAEIDHDTYQRRHRVLGANHPYTYFSANNYGRDLRDQGNLAGSRHWLEQAWKGYREVDGPDHPDTLRAAKNLAVTLRRLASFESAHQLSVDTLNRYNRKLGPEHPETLVCALCVATTHAGLGDDRTARTIGRSVVTEMTRVLGATHPYTLMARSNLAVFELKLGQASHSKPELSQVLDSLRDMLGEDHPVTLLVALNMANHHAALGDHHKARWLDQETHDRLLAVLGADHPDTLAAAINLAIGQRACGEEERANQTMGRVLPLVRTKLGEDHPRTIAARHGQRWVNTYLDPPPP